MTQQRIVVDSILSADNQTGTIADIDDDPDSPDANWLAAGTADSTFHGSFSAMDVADILEGQQEFRVLARKTSPGGADPDIAIYLFESGVQLSVIAATAAVTDTTAVFAGTWDAAALSDNTGANVEIWVDMTRSGGTPSGRRGVEIGAIEWNASAVTAGGYNPVPTILHMYGSMGVR